MEGRQTLVCSSGTLRSTPVARPVDCGGTLGVQGLELHRAPLPGRLAPMGNVLRLP